MPMLSLFIMLSLCVDDTMFSLKFSKCKNGGKCFETLQVLDWWHPDEKAVYPDYFARRDQRKKDYVEYYEKKYGKVPDAEAH